MGRFTVRVREHMIKKNSTYYDWSVYDADGIIRAHSEELYSKKSDANDEAGFFARFTNARVVTL